MLNLHYEGPIVEPEQVLPTGWKERVECVYSFFQDKKNNPTVIEHQVKNEKIRTLCSWMAVPEHLGTLTRHTKPRISMLASGLFDMTQNNRGNQGQEIGLLGGVLEGTDHVVALKAEGLTEESYQDDHESCAVAWVDRFINECKDRGINPYSVSLELVGHSEGNKQVVLAARELLKRGITPQIINLISGVGLVKENLQELKPDTLSLEQPMTALMLTKKTTRHSQKY